MNLALWVTQGLLATIFAVTGSLKLFRPKEKLVAAGMNSLAPYPQPVLRSVGVLELLGAAGLILPWLTGTAAVLTPLAALGLAALMVGAVHAHWRLRERQLAFGVVILLLACVFVAVGRFTGL